MWRYSGLLIALIFSLTLNENVEAAIHKYQISAHLRSSRSGADTQNMYGGRFRYDWVEGTLEYNQNRGQFNLFVAPIAILNQQSFFQPHVFAGLGSINSSIALVPGTGFRFQFGPFAIRFDVYAYIETSTRVNRMQIIGVAYSF